MRGTGLATLNFICNRRLHTALAKELRFEFLYSLTVVSRRVRDPFPEVRLPTPDRIRLAANGGTAMSVFLAATQTTFAIYCLIAFSHPGWVDGGQSAATINWRVPRWLANTLLIVICVVGIVGLLFATFQFLHSDYSRAFDLFDAFTGRNAASLLFGTITGVLLGAFITRVFFREPGSPIEARDKIIVALLLLFFALGIGGEEAIRGLAQRVSKVSVLGTEIDFSEPAKSSRANLRGGAPNTAVPLPSSSISSASSYGLTFLSNLSVLIERDRKYLIIAVKLKGGDAKILQNKIKEIDETLKQPSEFAKIIVEPFAVCLEELQTQTGDTEFVNDRLLGLVDELRILIAPDRDDDDMPSRLTKSFFKQSDELARFAMRIAVGPDVSKDPATRGTRANAIAASCNRLYFLLFDAECWHGQKSEAACWEEKKSALLNSSLLAGDWVWSHREEIRAFYQKPSNRTPTGEDSSLLSTPQGPSAASYITNVISEVSKSDSYRSRPYISMVYAERHGAGGSLRGCPSRAGPLATARQTGRAVELVCGACSQYAFHLDRGMASASFDVRADRAA